MVNSPNGQNQDFYDSLTFMGKLNLVAAATTISAYVVVHHGEDFKRIYTALVNPLTNVTANAADTIQLMYHLMTYYSS